jgi:hypothetical protein
VFLSEWFGVLGFRVYRICVSIRISLSYMNNNNNNDKNNTRNMLWLHREMDVFVSECESQLCACSHTPYCLLLFITLDA